MSRKRRGSFLATAVAFALLSLIGAAIADQATPPRLMLWATKPIGATNGDHCGPAVEKNQSANLPPAPPTLTEQDIESWNPDNGRIRLWPARRPATDTMRLLRDHCFVLALDGHVVERGIALDPESARMTGLPTLTLYRDQAAPYVQMTSGNHGLNVRVIHSAEIDTVLGNHANLRQQLQRLTDNSGAENSASLRAKWVSSVRQLIEGKKIREGMSLDDLRTLVGRETSSPRGYSGPYTWQFYSTDHVNPRLAVDVRNNIIQSFVFKNSERD